MINLNKHNFQAGDRVILDASFRNSSIVDIVRIGTVFATVRSTDEPVCAEWDTMISRLSPILKEPVKE